MRGHGNNTQEDLLSRESAKNHEHLLRECAIKGAQDGSLSAWSVGDMDAPDLDQHADILSEKLKGRFAQIVQESARALRVQWKITKEENVAIRKSLAEFRPAALASHLASFRCLRELQSALWNPIPHRLPALELCCNIESLPNVADDGHTSSHLAQAWKARHLALKEASWNSLTCVAGPRKCFKRQHCCCGAHGVATQKMCARLREGIADQCADKSFQQQLQDGFIIFQWSGRASPNAAKRRRTKKGTEQPPLPVHHLFTHVGLMYLRPWRPTLVMVEPRQGRGRSTGSVMEEGDRIAIDELMQRSVDGYVMFVCPQDINETMTVTTIWDMLGQLDIDLQWTVESWCLSRRQKACPALGSEAFAHKMPLPPIVVWNGIAGEPGPPRPGHRAAERRENPPQPPD